MKVLFLFAGVVALAFAASIGQQNPQFQPEQVDSSYKQKIVLQLFKNVYQPRYFPEITRVGTDYDFEANQQFYTNPKYVFELLEQYRLGFLPKGQVFSIFYDQHQHEAIAFFRVLYNAVDFETFYHAASWGRMHLNEGLYIYALSVALVHRPDTWHLQLPPIYEMYPFYFYNVEVLQKAHQYFFKGDYTKYFKPTQQQMNYYPGVNQYQYQQKQYPGQYPYQTTQYPGQFPYQQKQYPGQFPYQQKQYPGQFPYEQKHYPGQFPYQHKQYPAQFPYQQTPWNQKSYPYVYGQNPYVRQGDQYQQSYPVHYMQYNYGRTPYQQYQYPEQYEHYPQGVWNPKSYPYVYGQSPYQKLFPGQKEQYQYPQSVPYQQSYPVNYVQHTYGQTPYQQYPYPGQYEQYPYGVLNPKSYPHIYEQTPYQKPFPGQSEQYQYKQGGQYQQSYPWNYIQHIYGQTPYKQYPLYQYPGQFEQYQQKSYPYIYGKTPYQKQFPGYSEQYQQSYPWSMSQYKYGQIPYQQQFPEQMQQYQQGGLYQRTNPWNFIQFKYGQNAYQRQFPGLNEQYQQYRYPPSPYQKLFPGQSELFQQFKPLNYDQYKYEKTPYQKQFPGQMFPQYQEELYQQEREKAPEFFNNENIEGVTINYQYNTQNPLFYFTEDVGMNAFYYYYHIYFPFWMRNEEIIFKTEFRGEQYYYFHQQLLARYNLELVANGLNEIPLLDWDGLLDYGFETQLTYPNGNKFPYRPHSAPITPRWEVSMPHYDNDTMSLTNIKYYENRVLEAIDSGYVWTRDGQYVSIFNPQGFEVLGNLIQTNPESPNARYYGSIQVFARYVLGYSHYPVDEFNIAPSVLEHFETSLRDPAFYQLYKRIIYYFQRYKQYLPKYTPDELFMPGVRIQDVQIDKLVTYFDDFHTEISSALLGDVQEPQLENIQILVKQTRLNHQPFNYYLNVNCEKPIDAVIRVFLGPKYDQFGKEYNINQNRLNFVEIDKFQYSLIPGVNTIERSSRQSFFAPERTSYKELWMRVFNVRTPMYETTPAHIPWAMPQRFLLPKGTPQGRTFQMYFMITPYQGAMTKNYNQNMPTLFWDNQYDDLPYGYPFDRPIQEKYFFVPNSYFKDVVIYHEELGQQY